MDKDTEHDIGARRERPWLYAWVCIENEREHGKKKNAVMTDADKPLEP
jgi:hypothetical protein